MPRERRTFTEEFKRQMVQLYENGKSRADIIREHKLTASALDRWIPQANNSGKFTKKANRTPQENELLALRKENERLKMEVDILKQIATSTRYQQCATSYKCQRVLTIMNRKCVVLKTMLRV